MSEADSISHDSFSPGSLLSPEQQYHAEPSHLESERSTSSTNLHSQSGYHRKLTMESSKNRLRSSSDSHTGNLRQPSTDGVSSRIPRPPARYSALSMSSGTPTEQTRLKPPSAVFDSPSNLPRPSPTTTALPHPTKPTGTVPTPRSPLPGTIPIGTPVETLKEKIPGTLRFIGTTKFKEGIWAGIELDTPGTGKNDGSINGERYFNCAPKSGIFVDHRAVRPRTRTAKKYDTIPRTKPKLSTPGLKNPSPTSSLPGTKTTSSNRTSTPGQPTRPKPKTKSEPRHSISNPHSTNSIPSTGVGKTPRDRTSVGNHSNHSNSTTANRSAPRPKEPARTNSTEINISKIEDPDNDLAEYLNTPGVHPNTVVQNLLSQLHSTRKQNELLQLRINKKRAHNEATRVLRSEFVDKARQEILNRRVSQSLGFDGASDVNAHSDKEERIRELNFRISQNDIAIQALKDRACEFPIFPEGPEATQDLLADLRLKNQELQQIHMDLTDLQAQLSSKEDLLAELKSELDSIGSLVRPPTESTESHDTAKLTQVLRELEELKKSSTSEAQTLRDEIETLRSTQASQPAQDRDASGDPSQKDHDALLEKITDLEQQLELSNNHIKEAENLRQEAEAKRVDEIHSLEEKIEQLTEENGEIKLSLTHLEENSSSQPFEIESLQTKLDESAATIAKLQAQNDELKQSLSEANQRSTEADGNQAVSVEEFEELQKEVQDTNFHLESVQLEKENLAIQIKALRSALSQIDNASIPDMDRSAGGLKDEESLSELERLGSRIRQLEEDLALARATETPERPTGEGHDDTEHELKMRDQEMIRLKSEAADLEERYQQIAQTNSELLVDIQALEEDNWKLDDMYKEMQEEMEMVVAQSTSHKEKVGFLNQALEAASQDSNSGQKMRELMLQLDENETLHKAEIDSLYKVLDEQDEEMTYLTENRDTMKQEIERLRRELAKTQHQPSSYEKILASDLDPETMEALKDDDQLFCYLCCEVGHESTDCPNPPSLDEFDGSALDHSEMDLDIDSALSALDDILICGDCQEPGHSYTDCPNSTQIF